MTDWHASTDCRFYRGETPCRFKRLCPACPHYVPRGAEILIIKLAALGDVLRTTALLPGLRRRHGEKAYLTWLTRPEAREMVANQPLVDEVLPLGPETALGLTGRRFDAVYVLDKEPAATGLGLSVEAQKRWGFIHDERGALVPANPEAEYYWRLGLDDEEKFKKNTRSYQALLAEALGLDYRGERYELRPSEDDKWQAAEILDRGVNAKGLKSGAPLVGLNIGAGGVFANKNWPPERYGELIASRPDWTFIILGGPTEAVAMEELARLPNTLSGGSENPLLVFAALVERCAVVVTGDTLGLHVALAVGTPVATLFGPTSPREIELYGLGEKLVTSLDCAPCYRRACEVRPTCVEAIGNDAVLAAVERFL